MITRAFTKARKQQIAKTTCCLYLKTNKISTQLRKHSEKTIHNDPSLN